MSGEVVCDLLPQAGIPVRSLGCIIRFVIGDDKGDVGIGSGGIVLLDFDGEVQGVVLCGKERGSGLDTPTCIFIDLFGMDDEFRSESFFGINIELSIVVQFS